jgi:outer membrane protein assembly factor BamB
MLFAVLVAGAAVHAADEVPSWSSTPDRNMVSPARRLPTVFDESTLLWKRETKTRDHWTSPTIAGDLVLFGCDNRAIADEALAEAVKAIAKPTGGALLCYELRTGKLRWELGMDGDWSSHFGVCSSPVVEGDVAYLVDQLGGVICVDMQGQADGNDGPFQDEAAYMGFARKGVDPADVPPLRPTYGDILWRYDMRAELGIDLHDAYSGTVLVDGDLIWVNTGQGFGEGFVASTHVSGHLPENNPAGKTGKKRPNLIALDKTTGRLIARDEVVLPEVFHGQWSTPSMGVVDGRKLVFWGDGYGRLHAFRPPEPGRDEVQALEVAWSLDCNPPEYRRLDGETIPYVTGHGPKDADPDEEAAFKEKWKGIVPARGPSEIIATPVFDADSVYVAIGRDHNYCEKHRFGEGMLWRVRAADGRPVWSAPINRSLSTVAVADGLVYAADSSGKLTCLDAQTGAVVWEREIGKCNWCCSPVVVDGKVYVIVDRYLVVMAAGREPRELSRTRLRGEGPTPAFTHGLVVLPTQRELAVYATDREQ